MKKLCFLRGFAKELLNNTPEEPRGGGMNLIHFLLESDEPKWKGKNDNYLNV